MGSGNFMALDLDPYNTQHEKEFRKRMQNKKVLVPPGGFSHPDAPLVHNLPPPPSPRPPMRRSSSVGPRLATDASLVGAACVSLHSPAWRPTRRQGQIGTCGFSEHTQRQKTREIDILRFEDFIPRGRSSSCPPAIREAENGGSAVQHFAG